MIIKHKLKMELTGKETTPYVEVMQYDQLSRILEIAMMENGLPALLPENCRTMVRFWKPDGEEGIYDAMPDGRSAWYIKGNTVGIYLVPEVCTAAGTVKIVLQLLDGETLLYSFPVDVLVKENPKIKQRSRSYHHVTGFLPHPEKPRIGEFIRVVEVDEHGHVIRTETAEAMSGEGITREELEKAIDDYIEENGLAECIPGENGKSAYEIAVSQGFEGTQQEWLASLKGEKGDPGDPGQPGTQGKDGKSAYAYAQEAGYAGTEEEFAEKLSMGLLIGLTSETTPNQVLTAIQNNQNVYIMYIDRTFGVFAFNSFSINVSLSVIFSSSILQYNGMYAVVELAGYLDTDEWEFVIQQIPIMSNIPTKTSQLTNDSGFLTSAPVTSVNGKTGAVSIDIPTVPSALKNPYALTINGKSYDGSAAVEMTIESSSGDSIPDYVRTEAERVAKLVQSHQNANTITFLACSDIHYYSPDNVTANVNAEKMQEAVVSMGQAMGLIRQRVPIDFAAMFGDMLWDNGETREEVLNEMRFVNACLGEGFGPVLQLRMEGNHDDAYGSGGDLTAGEVFINIGAWNTGAVFGSREGNYCYRDFEGVKLRVICLNSSQYSGGAAQFNPEQVVWLANALDLSNKGADWRSIILSHHPLDWGKAGGTDPSATINAATGLIASFHGHIHNFLTGTVTNTELPRIAIPNAGYSRENQYGETYGVNWKESTTYSKTPGTAENTSFCVITIDLAAKKIYADHYGAGYDRIIPYDDVVLSTFTVTNDLTHVTNSNTSAVVEEGKSYTATLIAAEGYELKTVSITMGGTDITSTAYSGGKITIPAVTGNVVITAVAEENQTLTYTNLVPTSIGTDGALYGEDYNADGTPDGYKNGKYASGANEGNDDACVLTGLIPYGGNNTNPIYIKGADVTTASHCRILGFNAAKAVSFQSATGSAINTYFTVETLGTSYYKLTPTSEFKTAAGYKDYLRFSLIGTGTNLIITIGETIE